MQEHINPLLKFIVSGFLFVCSSFHLHAQNGYVILNVADSVITGFLKNYHAVSDGHEGIEVWRTKKDKHPIKIPKQQLSEYAINKDTFRVLSNFIPFPRVDVSFMLAEARLLSRGKVNLYIIEHYNNPKRISNYSGGGLLPLLIDELMGNYTYMYVLENRLTGYLRALPSKQDPMYEILRDFFPDRYLIRYAEEKSKINYKTIPDLVELYNSR